MTAIQPKIEECNVRFSETLMHLLPPSLQKCFFSATHRDY